MNNMNLSGIRKTMKHNIRYIAGRLIAIGLCVAMLMTAAVPAFAYTNNGAYIDKFGDFPARPNSAYEFVDRLYKGLLNREPDQAGLDSWVMVLAQRREDARTVIVKFLRSSEFERLTRNNELHFIYALYKTVYGSLDTLSRKDAIEWKTMLESKLWTRDRVIKKLLNAGEFLEICLSARVDMGDPFELSSYTDKIESVTKLILNLNHEFLGKSADRIDREDIERWCMDVYERRIDVESLIMDFFKKGGWETKNVSEPELIHTMYRAVLGRRADPSGLINCSKALRAGRSRTLVLRDIIRSSEFLRRYQIYAIIVYK